MLKTSLGRLRVLSLIEGLSLVLLLFLAMPMKYLFDSPLLVRVIGMAHGVLFIGLIFTTIMVGIELGWKFKRMGMIMLASIVPFGCFYVENKLFRQIANEKAD
jgi:integral membrane protein